MPFFNQLNYVTKIEIFVIVAIIIVTVYVSYSLDLFRKGK
jgi:hypothetical protein